MKPNCTVAMAFVYGAAGGLAVVVSAAAVTLFLSEWLVRRVGRS